MLRHTEPLLQYLLVWRIGFVWQQARHWDIAAPCWRRAHAVFTPSTARWRHVRAGRRPHWGRPMCGVWNRETSVPLSGRSSVQKPQTGRGHKPVYYCWLKLSLGRLAVLRVTAAVPDSRVDGYTYESAECSGHISFIADDWVSCLPLLEHYVVCARQTCQFLSDRDA